MKVQLSAEPTAYHRSEMESPATGRKGKRTNTLVADDLSWTHLPATEKKTSEGGTTTPPGGGTTPTPVGVGDEG